MASSSSSKRQFDVFVSFRGKDTRNTFTAYLLESLRRKGIDAFFDGKLLRGKNISELFERIEQSKMSIVVFSENYANSIWCLDELWKIIECKKEFGHEVLPIFYKVRKSDVENQTGSFGAPFLSPEESFKEDCHKIEAWKEALKTASNILGHVLPENRPEIEFLEEIAQETFRMVSNISPCEIRGLPGIESRSKELEKLLMFDNANCIRTIGVLGRAGIGKTTVVGSVYKRNHRRFDGYYFLEDIENESKRHGLHNLQQKLLCKLVNEQNVDVRAHGGLRNFVRNKKLFIVLDNVTEEYQINELIGELESYRKGSRIVVTTRDESLLSRNFDATYVVPRLNNREAMELFCLKAFSDKPLYPPEEFVDLSNNFVCYAKGQPLALKSLGADLRGKDVTSWMKKWESLGVTPDKVIPKVLKSPMAASSSPNMLSIVPENQVFLNFEGELRHNFISHLAKALEDKNINIDMGGEKGKSNEVSHSRIALTIFSEGYTNSNWCLDELFKIEDCMNLGILMVIPIFYKVKPDTVRHLQGPFGDVLRAKKQSVGGDQMYRWEKIFFSVCNYRCLLVFDGKRDENSFIDKIVQRVLKVITQISLAESTYGEVDHQERCRGLAWLARYLNRQGDWLEKTRGNLVVAATVIDSMSFDIMANPSRNIDMAHTGYNQP